MQQPFRPSRWQPLSGLSADSGEG
jgi:hypothetical protein